MARETKSMLEVMDDLYSLAYWMTGAEKSANELVCGIYMHAGIAASAKELLKTFRACYMERCRIDTAFGVSGSCSQPARRSGVSLRQRFVDMKLSVLLSEICGLNHQDISEITGTSLEAVRSRLSRGRKLLVNATMFTPRVEGKRIGVL